MIWLVASIAALAVGPVTMGTVVRRASLAIVFDWIVVGAITVLVILTVIPEAMAQGNWWTLGFAALGLLGPTAVERLFRGAEDSTHNLTLLLALSGLLIHATLDGAVLTGDPDQAHRGGDLLPLGIVLHRIAIGFALWWLVRPVFGSRVAIGVLTMVVVGTVIGYATGPAVLSGFSGEATAAFRAFVSGSLLHVAFHRPHVRHPTEQEQRNIEY